MTFPGTDGSGLFATLRGHFRIPVNPFKGKDHKRREELLTILRWDQLKEVARRLSDRYSKRAASSANTQVANAFIFGAEIALVLGVGGYMISTDSDLVRGLLWPSHLVASASLAVLIIGIILARRMARPSHTKDEFVEVAEEVLAGKIYQGAATENANRSMQQRYRLHVNDLCGTISMDLMLLTVAMLALGMTVYTFISFFI